MKTAKATTPLIVNVIFLKYLSSKGTNSGLKFFVSETNFVEVYPNPKVEKTAIVRIVFFRIPYSPKISFPKNLATTIPAIKASPLANTFPKRDQKESLSIFIEKNLFESNFILSTILK